MPVVLFSAVLLGPAFSLATKWKLGSQLSQVIYIGRTHVQIEEACVKESNISEKSHLL